MSSPVKRPAITYQRTSRKQVHLTESENEQPDFINNSISVTLNPDLALQQKINDLLFTKDSNKFVKPEEEFDSAYIESSENAKKVHDMVQVGETRRFIDEIEYLLDGLLQSDDGPKSAKSIRSNLSDIVEKCFKSSVKGFLGKSCDDSIEVNVAFGMKLKSHGALSKIFESLEASEDPEVLNNLIVLLCALLYDVRRLDFFFKPALAIKLARHCWKAPNGNDPVDPLLMLRLKSTQVILNVKQVEWTDEMQVFKYIGAWILFKWAFSGLTSTKSSDEKSFLDLISQDSELLAESVNIFIESDCFQIKEKVAGLLDCLLNRKGSSIHHESFPKLLRQLISEFQVEDSHDNLTFAKLAVSLTGSSFGRSLQKDDFIHHFRSLFELIRNEKREEFQVLMLSCLINLTDRCGESFIDELRLQKLDNGKVLLLESIAEAFHREQGESVQKSLLALLIGFICRENRTNFQVLTKALSDEECAALKSEIFSVATKFVLQQQQQQQTVRFSLSEDDKLIQDRLNEIVLKFK